MEIEQELYQRGIDKARRGDYLGAIQEFNRALRVNPQFGDAYYQRGLAHFDLKDIQGAIADYTQALQINSHNIEAYFGRSLAHLAGEEMSAAMDDVNRLIQLNPNHAPAYNLRATICRKLANTVAAIANYKKAAELYLDQKNAEKCRQCLDNIRQLKAANQETQNNRKETPRFNAEEFINQAFQKGICGQYGAAIEDFQWLIELNYQDTQLYYKRGLMHLQLGYHLRAIEDFNQTLQMQLNFPDAFYQRGIARAAFGDKFAAIADFEQAANLFQSQGNTVRYQQALEQKKNAEALIGKAKEKLAANSDVFEVKIQRREGGTPVIYVTFNRYLTFEMLLDTGASHTTITQSMANALGLVTVGIEIAVIANGQLIESPMAKVDSITVGSVSMQNLLVAIGAIPLLGQNFSGNYDITIKEKVIEFRVRSKSKSDSSEFIFSPKGKVSKDLQSKLLRLVGGDGATAARLVERERQKNPGMPENWYWEKAIYELERDRGFW